MRLHLTFFTLFLFFIQSFCFAQSYSEQGSPFVQYYLPNDYNGTSQVWCSVQDKRGMMYFGDGGGVIEFNGRSWKRIENANGSIVRSLAIDNYGRIYVGGSNEFGYLQPDRLGEMKYVSLSQTMIKQDLNFLDVWKTIVTSGGVYFFSTNYIFRYYNNMLSVFNIELEKLNAFDINDNIYFFDKKGNYMLRNSSIIKLGSNNSPSNLITFPDNKILKSEVNGLLSICDLKLVGSKAFNASAQRYFKNHYVISIQRIDKDAFAVVTRTGGIVIMSNSGKVLQIINKERGLTTDIIYTLYIDSDKNIWACTSKGIIKIDINFPVLKFDNQQNVNDIVQSTCVFNNKRYIATLDGVLYLPENKLNDFEYNGKFIKIKNLFDECWNFQVVNNHLMAICSSGVWIIKGDDARCIYKVDVNQSAHCLSTDFRFPDVLFIGMRGKLAYIKLNKCLDEGNVKVIEHYEFPEIDEKIRRITPDKDGNLWLNTQFNGMYFVRFIDENIRHFKITHLGTGNGLPNLQTTRTYKLNNEISITTDYGVLKPEFPSKAGAPDSLIQFKYSSVFKDKIKEPVLHILQISNNKYLVIGQSIFYVKTNGIDFDFDTCGFNRVSNNYIVTKSFLNNDGTISFCSDMAYLYYNTKVRRDFKKPYNALISKVIIGNDSTIFNGNFYEWIDSIKVISTKETSEFVPVIDYKYNSITIHYASLFYEEPEKTEFQYQLVGYDKNWRRWTKDNKAVYTNLHEGSYTFKVQALNIYGTKSIVAEYRFKIKAPIQRTWGAYFIYCLFLIFLIYLIVKIYTHRLSAQKDNLELIVKKRTEEIKKQANELEVINEKLVEMDIFRKDVTNMIVHDLKNPISSIINSSESDPEIQLIRIKQIGKKMLNLVLNILDVYKYEENQIVLNIETLQLLNIAQKAIDQVLFLCTEKNITISNRINPVYEVRADAEIIERVFINILSNSIKFTSNNGMIIIEAEPSSANSDLKGNVILDDFIKVAITDNGIGIASDKIHLVFQKFGQITAKSSGSVLSTGLGLTYCKMAVEAHGGIICVESEQGIGSRFWFTLPRVKDNNSMNQFLSYDIKNDSNKIELSQKSKQDIEQYLKELKNTEFYKITDLFVILDQIDDTVNIEIKIWKQALIDAIYNGNDLLFSQLVNI